MVIKMRRFQTIRDDIMMPVDLSSFSLSLRSFSLSARDNFNFPTSSGCNNRIGCDCFTYQMLLKALELILTTASKSELHS